MANSTERTVVGVFDEYTAARAAFRELAEAGIAPEAVHLQSNLATGAAGQGSASGSARPGGIKGFFERLMGGGENGDQAGDYAEAVRRGNTVMAVTAPENRADDVADIMNRHGATDIDRHVEHFRLAGYQTFDPDTPAYTYEEAQREREQFRDAKPEPTSGSRRSIPVVEEQVKIGKRTVQRGGVRIYSQVVEEPVSEEVLLHEERATVERRKVDRPVEPGEEAAFRNQSVEVTEFTEEPVVSKEARVKEEIVLGKEAKERTEKIRDTVRHTEVRVEQQDISERFRRDYDEDFARTGRPFESFRPAYQFGYDKARELGQRNQSWAEVEPHLEKEFRGTGDSLKWQEAKEAIRCGWEYGKTAKTR